MLLAAEKTSGSFSDFSRRSQLATERWVLRAGVSGTSCGIELCGGVYVGGGGGRVSDTFYSKQLCM